jgi:chorismate mutase
MIPIKELRPAGDTSADIRAALDRIAGERAETVQAIAAAKAARSDALLDGTASDLAKIEDQSRKLALHAEQLDALEARLKPLLDAAEVAEDIADYDAGAAVFAEMNGRLQEWVQTRYPEIVAEFREMLTLENEMVRYAARLSGFAAARRNLRPNSTAKIAAAMPKAWVRPDVPGLPFAFVIKLPNVEKGQPLWFQEHHELVPPNLEPYR